VLELTYTAHDLRPWAEEVLSEYERHFPHHGSLVADPFAPEPFAFEPTRRLKLRAELDARYARLYGLSREQLRYILDPSDTHGSEYPTETFRVLKNTEVRQYGEYRTRRLVLEAWDRAEASKPLSLPKEARMPAAEARVFWLEFLVAVARLTGDTLTLELLWQTYLILLSIQHITAEAHSVLGSDCDVWQESLAAEPAVPGVFADIVETLNANGKLQRQCRGRDIYLTVSDDIPVQPGSWRLYDAAAALAIQHARPAAAKVMRVGGAGSLQEEAARLEVLERKLA
jgi:hypothetical protein